MGTLLRPGACDGLRAMFAEDERFRTRIDMERFRFGKGEYKYFAYPLPAEVQALRERLYAELAPIASQWGAAFPATLHEFLRQCHDAGQTRPTPLVLHYEAGGYNCLHQDLYGDVVFPIQVVIGLSRPGVDYEGGELLLVEQRPRAQSVGQVVPLAQGEGVAITTRYRHVRGARGFHRTNMRHGVSPVRRGERYTLGLIFHDAK